MKHPGKRGHVVAIIDPNTNEPLPERPSRGYADMVGDLWHWGHGRFLEQCISLVDELIVGIHSDEDVESYKRRPVLTMKERCLAAAQCRFVDGVLPGAPLILTAKFLDDNQIDVVFHGDDLEHPEWYRVPKERGILLTLPYTEGISTTEIIERVKGLEG